MQQTNGDKPQARPDASSSLNLFSDQHNGGDGKPVCAPFGVEGARALKNANDSSALTKNTAESPPRPQNGKTTDKITAFFSDILIVCDDAEANTAFVSMLTPTFDLTFADSSARAKEILETSININLVIINIDGFEDLLAFAKKHPIQYMIPVVVCTDMDDKNAVTRALDLGAFDVWRKPLNSDLVFFKTYSILNRHSLLDKKTGLFTQEAFTSRAKKILLQNPDKSFYLIRFDIDNFKLYNHTYGMYAGDELLRYIGQKSADVATADTLFCRLENDHFIGIVEERYLSSRNIIHYFTNLTQSFHPEYHLSIQMGLYKIEDKTLSMMQMIDRAHVAHQSSKRDNTTRHSFYDERMLKKQIEEQQLTDEMVQALAEEQFVVYLQPQYNQSTMNLYGAEALVRWKHPKRGLISPAVFIPLFEKNGFITELDRYIFKKVCAVQRKWLDTGLNVVPISVNISRTEAQNANLCNEFLDILNEYHLQSSNIRLEITESAYMDNPGQVIALARQLRDAGFELEMDDFGSGYSSLNTLKEIPVDVLKLDLKFFCGKDELDRSTSILSSIIRMAHSMHMPIIAEGIETKEQAELLKSLNCFYIQGFLFDRPMPIADFENRLLDVMPDSLQTNRFTPQSLNTDTLDIDSLLAEFMGPAAILEYDGEKFEWVRCNESFYAFFCITTETSPNRTLDIRTVINEDEYSVFSTAVMQAIDSKDTIEVELKLEAVFGENAPTWIKVRTHYLSHTDNTYTFYITVRSIDEEKHLEQQYEALKDDLHALSDVFPGGALAVEVAHDAFIITNANTGIASMLGCTPSEFGENVHNDLFHYIHPDDKERVKQSALQALHSYETHFESTFRLCAKDSSILNVFAFCKIKTNPDDTFSVVVSVLDVGAKEKDFAYISELENENRLMRKQLALSAKYREKQQTEPQKEQAADSQNVHNMESMKESSERKTDSSVCTAIATLAQTALNYASFTYDHMQDKFMDISPSFTALFGYTRKDFYIRVNDTFSKFVYKEDRRLFSKGQHNIDKGPLEEIDLEHRVVTKNGSVKWVHTITKKLCDKNGKDYFCGVMIDIDKQKKQEALIESQNFTIQALENTTEGATVRYKVVGSKLSIDFISQRNALLFGYEVEELRKLWRKNIYALIHPDDIAAVKKDAFSTIKNNTLHEITFRVRKRDGSYLTLLSKGVCYRLQNCEYFVVTCYNITKQLSNEQQLIEEKQRLHTLLNAMPYGVALYEIRPDRLKLLFATEKVAAIFGRTREEFRSDVEDDPNLAVLGSDVEIVRSNIKYLEKTGEPVSFNFRVVHKDGSLVWASVNAHKTGENRGNPVFLAIYQDNTQNTITLNQILSRTNFIIVVYDFDTKELLYANPTAESFAHKMFDKFTPMTVHEFLYNNTIDVSYAILDDDFEFDEYEAVRFGHEIHVKRMRITWSGRDSILVLMEDLTKKNFETRKLYRIMTSRTGAGVIFKADEKKILQRVCLSEEAQKLLHFTEEEGQVATFDQLMQRIHPEDRARIKERSLYAINNRVPFIEEYRHIDSNGNVIRIELDVAPVGTEKTDLFFYGTYTDISHKKHGTTAPAPTH